MLPGRAGVCASCPDLLGAADQLSASTRSRRSGWPASQPVRRNPETVVGEEMTAGTAGDAVSRMIGRSVILDLAREADRMTYVVGSEPAAPSAMRSSDSSRMACACALGSSLEDSSGGRPSARSVTFCGLGTPSSSSAARSSLIGTTSASHSFQVRRSQTCQPGRFSEAQREPNRSR